jgi:hypothetical protein
MTLYHFRIVYILLFLQVYCYGFYISKYTIRDNTFILKGNKRSKEIKTNKGFAKIEPSQLTAPSTPENNVSLLSNKSESKNAVKETSKMAQEPILSEPEIFQKYGIKIGENPIETKRKKDKTPDDRDYAFGESVLDKIPTSTQAKIDRALVNLTFFSLSIVVLTGVAISFGAFRVVYPEVSISPDLERVITDILAPAFSPALGVFFFFSITFGLFKFAQVSSSQTVYRE